MQFVSTRGQAPVLGFCDAVLSGLASDGGLYLPDAWPKVSVSEIAGYAGRPYADVAYAIISRFVGGEIPYATLKGIIDGAYEGFRHPSVTPIVEIGPNRFLLELFHGPTLAFKDVAMQFLARLMDHILATRNARATIVGATSGDTGSAAIEAFKGRSATDIFILHPHGRTSGIQRRQMTTVADENVHNIAVSGTFDDCQALVKGMFNDKPFREQMHLSGVNSINLGRIVAQIVYYFTAAVSLGAPHRKVSFVVPTGNFGDIFAGYAAKRMGLPIANLVIATNSNDILARTIESGRYEVGPVTPTMSPSMDIQVSSNFERLMFEALNRDSYALTRLMNSQQQSGAFTMPAGALAAIRESFAAGRATETETAATITKIAKTAGYTLDPHTAVGVTVASKLELGQDPVVILATAHPAKFPSAVREATGVEPPLPVWLADLRERPERYDVLAADLGAIEAYVRALSRAGRS